MGRFFESLHQLLSFRRTLDSLSPGNVTTETLDLSTPSSKKRKAPSNWHTVTWKLCVSLLSRSRVRAQCSFEDVLHVITQSFNNNCVGKRYTLRPTSMQLAGRHGGKSFSASLVSPQDRQLPAQGGLDVLARCLTKQGETNQHIWHDASTCIAGEAGHPDNVMKQEPARMELPNCGKGMCVFGSSERFNDIHSRREAH